MAIQVDGGGSGGWQPGGKPKKKYNPADEGNGFGSDPLLDQAVADATDAGLVVGGDQFNTFVGGRYQRYRNGDAPPPPPAAPTGPGGGRGPSGPSAAQTAATNAIKTLMGMYNKPGNTDLLAQLGTVVGQSTAQGNTAVDNLQAVLGGMRNPYTDALPQAQQAVNPLQQYLKATGTSPDAVNAEVALNNANQRAQGNAAQQMLSRLQQAWNARQQGLSQQAEQQRTQFAQQMAAQQAAMQFKLAQQEQTRKNDLMMQVLQMAVQNGLDLNKLGVKF